MTDSRRVASSSSASASRSIAAAFLLVLVGVGLGWYLIDALNATETQPVAGMAGPAMAARSDVPAGPAADPGAIERREAAPVSVPSQAARNDAASVNAPAVSAAETVAVVHGRVVNVRGAGVADCKVSVLRDDLIPAGLSLGLPREVRDAGSDTVTTDAAGEFVLALRKLGPFELIAAHDEHPSARHKGAADRPRVDGVTIVLRDGGSIEGVVVGAPADAGELLVVARHVEEGVAAAVGAVGSAMFDFGGMFDSLDLPIGARRVTAAADGTFRLNGLEPGAQFSLFAMRGAQDGQRTRCTERAEAREGAHGVQLRWRETLGIVVRVVDAATGAPIEDLTVSVGPVTRMVVLGMSMPIPIRQPVAQTRFPGGVVQIDGIGVDDGKTPELSLELRALGRRPWSRDDVDATRRGRIDLGVVQLVAAPVVRVTVACGAEPVAGATVRLEQFGASEAVDRDAGNRRSISFSTNVATPTSADNGEDLARRVKVGDNDLSATTDARGVCELTAAFEGKVGIVVASPRHAAFRGEPFELPVHGVVEQRAELWRGGTAIVRTVDGHGAPLANAMVRHRGADPNDTESAVTDANGALTFERVPPGVHSFAIDEKPSSPNGLRIDLGVANGRTDLDETRVSIADGQEVAVLVHAPLRGSLRGVVTLDGEPIDRAEIRVVDAPRAGEAADASAEVGAAVESMLDGLVGIDQGQRTKSGADGDYELADLRAGARRVLITHKDLAMPAYSDVTIVEGSNLHDVVLRSTTLRGRVLDAAGKPVQGAAVAVAIDTADADEIAAGTEEMMGMFGQLFGGGGRETVRTAADGTFELRGVRPGVPLRVRASSRLHVADSVGVAAVAAGSAREGVELRLAAAGRVRVRATVDGALAVQAEWAGPTPAPTGAGSARSTMLKAGRATLEGLPPGRWKLTLEGAPALEALGLERIVEVAAGQTAAVEF